MNMLFTHEIHHLGGETFEVDVDDQTLTWTSKPPGKSIPRPITLPMIGDDF